MFLMHNYIAYTALTSGFFLTNTETLWGGCRELSEAAVGIVLPGDVAVDVLHF